MSQKGISFRLNLHITSIAIIIIASIVYLNYHFSNKILIHKIEEGAVNQSNLVISKIARITVGTEEIARNVSYQAPYYAKNHDLDFFLTQVLNTNSILESIHIELIDSRKNTFFKFSSNKQGQHVCNPDSLSIEKYFRKLSSENLNTNQGIWSDPFYCKFNPTNLLVSYRYPIFNPENKTVDGFVSCEISLSKMDKMLTEVRISRLGYSFIVDKTGEIITHPKKEWILHKNLFEKPSLIFPENLEVVESQIRNGRSGAGYGTSQYLNDQKAWFYYSPLPSSNWTIVIVAPENELHKELDVIFQKIILVSVLGILILLMANILIFRRLLNPLVRITHAIERFSSFPGHAKKSKNEINRLANSLEDWQAKYGVFIKEQANTAKEKIKYTKDLKSAQEIQFNIIPSGKPTFPENPEIDLFAIIKPAELVGGDLYDYFFIDKDHLLVAIGDVSGKGIAASLFMAIVSTLIKSHAKILSAKEIVSQVNEELSNRNSNQYFVTLFIGILDTQTGIMDYCNAAHNFPYILHADGKLKTLSKSHGLPLGIYKNKTYNSSTIELHAEDLLILYTDGVINSKDSKNQHYGIERLENNIQNLINLTAEEATTRLVKSIVIYEGSESQADDITLLTLKYLNKRETRA